jgi:hypothetical protein
MQLSLFRFNKTSLSTGGKLAVNGVSECYTLELPLGDSKPGSAIPEGTFGVVLAPSPKFLHSSDPWVLQYANAMPHLTNIPGRSLIMIHWGNTPHDTEGCILVGQTHSQDSIGSSRAAFEALYSKIQAPLTSGESISVTVSN